MSLFLSSLESDLNQYWGCGDPSIPSKPFLFYRIVTFSICMDTVFHFFHLLSCCLSFLVRGWLMWVYPTIQAINVGLSMHLSSTHLPRNRWILPSIIWSMHVNIHMKTPTTHLVCFLLVICPGITA